MLKKYPKYLSLDVSTDNEKAVHFYERIGLDKCETYLSDDKVEFAKFETPQDYNFDEERVQGIYQGKNNKILKLYGSDDDETQMSESEQSDKSSTLLSDG